MMSDSSARSHSSLGDLAKVDSEQAVKMSSLRFQKTASMESFGT